jgi:hypothetical protein
VNGSSRVADPWADEHSGTRTLDLALGVLVGLRRYDAKDAFSELVDVSTRRGLSPFALGRALVAAASGHPVLDSDAAAAVADEWSNMLVDTRVTS